jgi:hypothetical protein
VQGNAVDESAPTPTRPASHRAKPPLSEAARRLVPALTAVTAVVVVIVLLLFLNSRPTRGDGGPGPAVVATGPTTAADPTAATPSRHPTPTPKAASAVAAPPVSEPPATQTAAVAKLPLTVLNNSRIAGLAHEAAAQVARGGWPIKYIGNFTGRIVASTVYYAAGERPSAEALARQFRAVRRVLPRFAGLPGSGLTLVVTRDWSG